MLDWLTAYGGQLTALIIAVTGLVTATYSVITTFKTGKKVDANSKTYDEKIKITRDGIVEAFKSAKIPSEWKISISKQVDAKLTEWREEFIKTLKESETLRNEMMALILKILSFTVASDKLTPDEKARLEELVKLISDFDATIDITD